MFCHAVLCTRKEIAISFRSLTVYSQLHLQLMLGASDGLAVLTDAARACVRVRVRVSVHVRG